MYVSRVLSAGDAILRRKLKSMVAPHMLSSCAHVGMICLLEPVDHLKESQNDIYCITGEIAAAASCYSSCESLSKKGLESTWLTPLTSGVDGI